MAPLALGSDCDNSLFVFGGSRMRDAGGNCWQCVVVKMFWIMFLGERVGW